MLKSLNVKEWAKDQLLGNHRSEYFELYMWYTIFNTLAPDYNGSKHAEEVIVPMKTLTNLKKNGATFYYLLQNTFQYNKTFEGGMLAYAEETLKLVFSTRVRSKTEIHV